MLLYLTLNRCFMLFTQQLYYSAFFLQLYTLSILQHSLKHQSEAPDHITTVFMLTGNRRSNVMYFISIIFQHCQRPEKWVIRNSAFVLIFTTESNLTMSLGTANLLFLQHLIVKCLIGSCFVCLLVLRTTYTHASNMHIFSMS